MEQKWIDPPVILPGDLMAEWLVCHKELYLAQKRYDHARRAAKA